MEYKQKINLFFGALVIYCRRSFDISGSEITVSESALNCRQQSPLLLAALSALTSLSPSLTIFSPSIQRTY
jgi:hypothetical protein